MKNSKEIPLSYCMAKMSSLVKYLFRAGPSYSLGDEVSIIHSDVEEEIVLKTKSCYFDWRFLEKVLELTGGSTPITWYVEAEGENLNLVFKYDSQK